MANIHYLLTGGDWRPGTTSAEITMLVNFINSMPTGVSGFIGSGDQAGNNITSKVKIPAKWCPGNHDGCGSNTCGKDYTADLFGWGILQYLQGGYLGKASDFDKINQNGLPVFYLQHTNFIDSCSGAHGKEGYSVLTLLDGSVGKLVIGAGCGHNHNYAEGYKTPSGSNPRVYMQSGTSSKIRYCGPAFWRFGLYKLDTSVSGKLTVSYKGVDIANTFTIPTSWTWTYTVNMTPAPSTPGTPSKLSVTLSIK